ncbi:MAG: ChbG/HpnK family deacetylase [Marinilabiliales bacterium]|nr:ChbG/HpnK family deacetylase [Marinilabiliales bacterium]
MTRSSPTSPASTWTRSRRVATAGRAVHSGPPGRRPTHLDSHHHSSYFTAGLFRAMLELAKEYDCPIRYPFTDISREIEETGKHAAELMTEFNPRRPEMFLSKFYDDGATLEVLFDIINHLGNGTSELMCHPGRVDEAFARESVYNFQRERELKILTDPAVRRAVLAKDIDLISFADL